MAKTIILSDTVEAAAEQAVERWRPGTILEPDDYPKAVGELWGILALIMEWKAND